MRAIVCAAASVLVSGVLSVPAVANADSCINGDVRGGAANDYFVCQDRGWLHVMPASGGPVGPGCVAFPDKVMCPSGEPPPGPEWTTPGRWFPGS
jgi:hypothetical protein